MSKLTYVGISMEKGVEKPTCLGGDGGNSLYSTYSSVIIC